MALDIRKSRRCTPVLTVSALVLALPLALSTSASALQCPKGYVGQQTSKGPKCVQQHSGQKKDSGHKETHKKSNGQTVKRTCGGEPCGSTTSHQTLSDSDNIPNNKSKKTHTSRSSNSDSDSVPSTASKQKKSDEAKSKAADKGKSGTPAAGSLGGGGGGSANSSADSIPKNDKGKATADTGNTNKRDRMSNSDADSVPDGNDGKKKTRPPVAGSSEDNVPETTKTKSKSASRNASDDDDDDKPAKAKSRSAADKDDDKPKAKAAKASDDDNDDRSSRKASRPTSTASIGSAGGAGSGFTHNNSRMSVVTSGDQLTIAYDRPRDGLSDLGIKPGTPLFKGTRNGNKVTGEATTFSRRCGTRTFAVSGQRSSDGTRYELTGAKPILDGDCNVTGTTNEVLVFAADN